MGEEVDDGLFRDIGWGRLWSSYGGVGMLISMASSCAYKRNPSCGGFCSLSFFVLVVLLSLCPFVLFPFFLFLLGVSADYADDEGTACKWLSDGQ